MRASFDYTVAQSLWDLTQNPSLESGCVSLHAFTGSLDDITTELLQGPMHALQDSLFPLKIHFRSSSFFKKQDGIMWFTKTYKHLRVPKTFSQYCTLHIVCMIHVFSMSPASTLSWYFTSAGSPEGGAGYLVTTGSKIKAVWQVYDDMRHWERIQKPPHCRDTETLTMHFHTFTSGEDLGNNTALKLTCSTKARH